MKKFVIIIKVKPRESSATLIDHKFKIVAQHFQNIDIIRPKKGWIEYDPIEIYHSVLTCIVQLLNIASITPTDIEGISIVNETQSTLVWNKETGLPIYNVIAWNDHRTRHYCYNLNSEKSHKIKIKSGLVVNGQNAASKIQWILDEIPNARYEANSNKLLFGTIDSWLVWKLTIGLVHITDVTNASKTALMNLKALVWDKDLLEIFKIPASMCPDIKSSTEVYGFLDTKHILPFSHYKHLKIPICSVSGVQNASFLAQNCAEKNEVKITIYDSAFVCINTGRQITKSNSEVDSSISICTTDNLKNVRYSLESNILNSGYIIKWLKRNLKLIYDDNQIEWYVQNTDADYQEMNPIIFVPAFDGMSAPYYDNKIKGGIFGLDHHTKREDIIKAALESIAYQNAAVIKSIDQNLKGRIKTIKIEGPLSHNKYLMQLQANISQTRVLVNKTDDKDLIVIGSAILTWRALGNNYNFRTIKENKDFEIYLPNITIKSALKLMNLWQSKINWLKK